MYKVAITLVLIILPFLGFSQDFFDNYEDREGVTSVFVNNDMFRLIGDIDVDTDDPEAKEFMNMIENLKNLKMLQTDDKKVSSEIVAKANSHVSKNKLQELMRVNDDGQKIKFFIQRGKDESHVKELFMLMTGTGDKPDTVVMSIKGDIDLKQISKLTKQMNIPGGEHLEKKGKNK